MGGENFNWQGTPLFPLYEKHNKKGHSSEISIEKAGKDAGWLLKKVINLDSRIFETKKEDLIHKYRWKK